MTFRSAPNTLSNLPSTSELIDPHVERLGRTFKCNSGFVLFEQDWDAHYVFLIREGVIKLVWSEPEGKDAIVGLRWPGSLVGADAVLAGRPHPATAIALFRCTLERISADSFIQLIRSEAEFSLHVHEIMSKEFCEQTMTLGELACSFSRKRLEHLLQRLFAITAKDNAEKGERFLLPLKRKELAEILGVTPEHLSRLLRSLQREGIIRTHGQRIIIPERKSSTRRAHLLTIG